MNDLISRADAIDALAYFTEKSLTGRTAQELVKALPSAQPEIIHCKECKFLNYGFCEWFDSFVHDDDFCSYGSREEET